MLLKSTLLLIAFAATSVLGDTPNYIAKGVMEVTYRPIPVGEYLHEVMEACEGYKDTHKDKEETELLTECFQSYRQAMDEAVRTPGTAAFKAKILLNPLPQDIPIPRELEEIVKGRVEKPIGVDRSLKDKLSPTQPPARRKRVKKQRYSSTNVERWSEDQAAMDILEVIGGFATGEYSQQAIENGRRILKTMVRRQMSVAKLLRTARQLPQRKSRPRRQFKTFVLTPRPGTEFPSELQRDFQRKAAVGEKMPAKESGGMMNAPARRVSDRPGVPSWVAQISTSGQKASTPFLNKDGIEMDSRVKSLLNKDDIDTNTRAQ